MYLILLLVVAFLTLAGILYVKHLLKKRKIKNTIAFFHLYCLSGGGGERVLWNIVEIILNKYPQYKIYIYCHKTISKSTPDILRKVKETFKIDLLSIENTDGRLEFIPLTCSALVEPQHYPFLTLLLQAIGSIVVAVEALIRLMPEVYVETIGFSFTLPLFKFFDCKVLTYVHYPMVSNDMIYSVKTSSHPSFNNRQIFIKSSLLRQAKLIYYHVIAYLYGFAGRHADLVMVNSTWTQSHLQNLWKTTCCVLFPPCDVESFKNQGISHPIVSDYDFSPLRVVSIAQFRPEKRHQVQIEAFDQFLSRTKAYNSKLTIYGGCRDESDMSRVHYLRDLVQTLNLNSNIDLVVGAPFSTLLEGIRCADVALHSMKNEHFGIVLLECMAAGLIVVAHSSGGPKTDIIDHGENGFLADEVTDFADRLVEISTMKYEERRRMSEAAKVKADQFTNRRFMNRFIRLARPILS